MLSHSHRKNFMATLHTHSLMNFLFEFLKTEPQKLTVTKTTSESITLSWRPPSPNGKFIDYYKVVVTKAPNGATPIVFTESRTEALCKKLQPNTQYKFRVSACGRSVNCSRAAEITAWTAPRSK